HVTLVDPAACESILSSTLPESIGGLLSAEGQLIWIEDGAVQVHRVENGVERAISLAHPGVALHLDGEWLYALTAATNDAGLGAEVWLERVPRSALNEDVIASEPWISVALEAGTRWSKAQVKGSSERLLVSFWDPDSDAESVGPTIRIHRTTGAQDLLSPNETTFAMFTLGSRVYAQRAKELVVLSEGEEPRTLRGDLDNRQLVGVISEYAIVREPSAKLLLALPFSSDAPLQVADEQAAFAGVATSGNDIYWVNWAQRLMTVSGVPQ
ncbi:MAG TPA: hypothetical protein VK524_19695, partial [Polyangiaceae bacterium]|nr:hypothetical protein [Polyangiaceae bacterium]